jgi:hypothetical protein
MEMSDPRKTPGEDALTSQILLHVFRRLLAVFTEI